MIEVDGRQIILAPSILAADFGRLVEQARTAVEAGADWLHVDVMDGHFVPNISLGPVVMRGLKGLSDEMAVPLDVHLMIEEPDRYLAEFARAGASRLTVHVESGPHTHRTVQAIKELGVAAGITLNPATPLDMVEELLTDVDLVLIMSVNPGFGGQTYIPRSTARIQRLRQMLADSGSQAFIEVDGGVKPSNASEIVDAGADVLVAGSAIFKGDIAANIALFRQALQGVKVEK